MRPTRARLLMLALITAGTLVNYLDRTVISVAAPFLARDLHLDYAVLGIAFSAFSWTYAAAQIPGGIALDRFGVRLT
jgi:MFS transporter, ACS family, D-galactonate transporter